jgi:hypothetical protein
VISCASAGLALPENKAIDKDPNSLFCDINLAQLAGVEGLFGPAGLTPPGPPFGRYPSSS